MGETTISWTATQLPDGRVYPGYTMNPWIGCTKVSQGCKLCYAMTQNSRYNWNPDGWGKGKPRHRTSEANWKKPLAWAKKAKEENAKARVFCASLADVFDPEVDVQWRIDLFYLISEVEITYPGRLEWMILTKRIENVAEMFPFTWGSYLQDCIRLGVTTEDYENAEERIPELLRVWKGKNFISYEPALTLIDFWPWLGDFPKLHYIAMGGESGSGCRPMRPEWVGMVARQCRLAKIPFHLKQLGGFPDKRHDPAKWPEELRIQNLLGV